MTGGKQMSYFCTYGLNDVVVLAVVKCILFLFNVDYEMLS